jgi:nicotinamidase-related amidase
VTKDALLVIDMQEGLLRGAPKHDLPGVVARIIWANLIAPHPVAIVRAVDVYPETDAHPADVDAATGGAR